MNAKPRIIVISGPTGMGKSELAVSLAEHVNGEVINLDSVQAYRELEIGAAKPRSELRMRAAHHLFDCASIGEHFDVGTYRALAVAKINEVRARGKQPILCGGSTMYLTVLLHGLMQTAPSAALIYGPSGELSAESSRDQNTLARPPNKRPGFTTDILYQQLMARDPVRAQQIHAHDRQRIGRALDLLDQGVMPSEQAKQHRFQGVFFDALIFIKTGIPAGIYRRINERAAFMVKNGIIEETRSLLARFGRVRALESLGYRQVLDWNGESLEALVAEIATATRRYAKRQSTFWRNEPVKRGWQSSSVQVQADSLAPLVCTETARWLADPTRGGYELRRLEQP